MEAICKYCHRPFSYEFKEDAKREREREVCDECQECRRRWARKKVRRTEGPPGVTRRKVLRFQIEARGLCGSWSRGNC